MIKSIIDRNNGVSEVSVDGTKADILLEFGTLAQDMFERFDEDLIISLVAKAAVLAKESK